MLVNLRKFATSIGGKILGGFLLISLAGFGITGVIFSIGSNTVARVGDRDISFQDFQRAYQNQISIVANQVGTVPTPEQALAFGIPSAVLNRLATDESLNILTSDFGLGVSNDRLAQELRSDPAFTDALGNFDRNTFERTLNNAGYTENSFFEDRREAAARQQIALAMFSQVRPPKTLRDIMQRFGEDRRILNFVVLSENSLLPIGNPANDVLQAYLNDNQDRYRAPQTRTIKVVQLSPEILAENIDVSEAEVLAEYDRTRQNLFTVETRAISFAPLPDDDSVALFEIGIGDGKDFTTLVEELGLEAIVLGNLTQAQIPEVLLGQRAFELDLNEISIIPGVEGKRALVVTNIVEGGEISFEDAAKRIEQALKVDKGRLQYIEVLDQIEEQRAAFVNLEQSASEFDLEVKEIAITAGGPELVDEMGLDAGEAERVSTVVFGSEVGRLVPSVPLGANKTVWFDILRVDEERDQTMAEIGDELAVEWMDEQRARELEELAQSYVEQLQAGKSLEEIAVLNGLFPQISAPLSRIGDGAAIDPQVAEAAYGGGEGFIGSARNGAGDYVVFAVDSITSVSDELNADNMQFIDDGYRNTLFADFTSALNVDSRMNINQQVLTQAIGLGLPQAVSPNHLP
ncbi:MAG: SurA N-terminal domain-containing protein [Devosiaceae bacterium]|nr:SurA N-terminal domain-containing protein [Devosiaceae bacterium]